MYLQTTPSSIPKCMMFASNFKFLSGFKGGNFETRPDMKGETLMRVFAAFAPSYLLGDNIVP